MSLDPELRDLLDDVVRSVDEDIDVEPGCPDLAAVVARAHELDPQRVRAEHVSEVSQGAPVVSIRQGHRRRRTRDDVELMAVIDGVRSYVEQDVALGLGSPPAIEPAPEPASSPSRRYGIIALAVAAALLLVAAVVLKMGRQRLERDEASRNEASLLGPTPAFERVQDTRVKVAPDAEPRPGTSAEQRAPDAAAEPAAEPTSSPAKPRRRSVLTLEELDAAAHAAWRAGDRARAERLFRTLARRAGKGRLGDLAYGDLFTLARQTQSPRREVALWREYLRRFPRGRFADDARAGLCRRTDGAAQQECWQRYLRELPRGTHRAQARRALASSEEAP